MMRLGQSNCAGFVLLPFFAYTEIVPTARSCSVSFRGFGRNHPCRGDHRVQLVRSCGSCYGGIPAPWFGSATTLNVRVKAPEAAHVVSVGKVKAWLDRVGKSPREQVEKNRLKYLLTR